MEGNYIDVLVQAGAVGISFFLIFLIWQGLKMFKEYLCVHTEQQTEALNKLNATIEGTKETISEVYQYIKKKNGN